MAAMNQTLMVESVKTIMALAPVNITGAAQVGDYVSLRYSRRARIVLQQGAWAGGTPAVTITQSKDNAGGSEKSLSMNYYYQCTGLTSDTITRTAITSDTFNLPATANTTTFIEVDAGDLDINNGFTFLCCKVASPGSNADLLCIMYDLYENDYQGDPAKLPTVIA